MFQLIFVMIPAFVRDVYNKCTILNSTSLLSCLFPGGRYLFLLSKESHVYNYFGCQIKVLSLYKVFLSLLTRCTSQGYVSVQGREESGPYI